MRLCLQKMYIVGQLLNLIDHHASFDPPLDRLWFVIGKIMTSVGAQQDKDLLQGITRHRLKQRRISGVGGWQWVTNHLLGIGQEFCRHLCRR